MMRVDVQSHQKQWAKQFQSEKQKINSILGKELFEIYHIGSTSVPGLEAKPIIDILIVIQDINKIDTFNAVMANMGYKALGENGIKGRRFFKKGENPRTHHVHVFEKGSHNEINRHLAVRDYLRTHTIVARKYAALKVALAEQFPNDIEAYCDGKDAFVKQMESDALEWYLQ